MTGRATVVEGGAVFTGVAYLPAPAAVAVRDGRVVAVGEVGDVREQAGGSAEVVDASGCLVVPGFQDAHVHAVWGAVERNRCGLVELSGLDAYLAALDRYAREHPAHDWIKGGGWRMTEVPRGGPLAAHLDAVVADRPVFLWSKDGHMGWANRRALELAGVDAATPDPPGGRIGRLDGGAPSGALYETAMSLVTEVMPATGHDELVAAVHDAQRYLHSLGITAWQDAIVARHPGDGDPVDAYVEVARADGLIACVTGALWWERTRGLEQVADLVDRRERYSVGHFRCTAVKIMLDGIMESCTASLLAPYADPTLDPHAGHGSSFVDADLLAGAVTALDRAGFDVHFHAIGDRAVRDALDAVAAARRANGPRDARHQIAHVQLVDPDDLGRFAELGAVANIQPYWATRQQLMVTHTMPLLGPPRSERQYPFGDLGRAGAALAAGSDWPVSTPDPLAGIHVAVNRTMVPGHRGAGAPPLFPEQALTLAQALRAYTAGAAHANRLDDAGRLAPGLAGDLAIVDRDLFAGPTDEIGLARVERTVVGGHTVFDRHAAGA